MFQPGQRVGAYRLEALQGGGATGEVWRVLAADGARVALKFALAADEARQARYHAALANEAHFLAQVRHPRLPVLLGQALDDQPPYLVLSFMAGENWQAAMRQASWFARTLAERLALLDDLARTIDSLHAWGWIHRDIKPANILIDQARAYLLDFSLTCRADSAQEDGAGTPLYLPPEPQPSRAGDAYAFAVLSYEVLFGSHPFWEARDEARAPRSLAALYAERLSQGAWASPSRLDRGHLPHDLWGADLAALESLFVQGLGPAHGRPARLVDWVEGLRAAVFVPGNAAYVEQPAPPQGAILPTEEDFTDHQVNPAATDHPRRWW
jgi:serine/threonine protein kinase